MTAVDALAVVLVAGAVAPLLWRWMGRWSAREFDRHVSMAQLLANGPCLCAHPERPGCVHSPVRCVPPTPPCDCKGTFSDPSGVVHGPLVCMPFREALFPKRGAA